MHKRLMVFMANNEVAGVQRVLRQAVRNGMSIYAVLDRMQLALRGRYRARCYSEKDLDLAVLVLRIGGQALLHALHRGAGFPSITYVYDRMKSREASIHRAAF